MNEDDVHTNRATTLLALISTCLHGHAEDHTARYLGDRHEYIGMSDIGRGLSCLRSAVGHKLPDEVENQPISQAQAYQPVSLAKQLRFQRGHWFEEGLAKTFRSQHMPVIEQLEIATSHQGVPIKAHLDFTFVSRTPRPVVRILEVKSCEHIPSNIYSSYEAQVYGQVGLFSSLWNQRVFGLRDGAGAMLMSQKTFPEIAQHLFGFDLPCDPGDVDIEAWILCLSMSEAQAFGPYQPNDIMLHMCLQTAGDIWRARNEVQSGIRDFDDLPVAKGHYPLCDWCAYNEDCPKFDGEYQPQWEETLLHLATLKENQAELAAQIAETEDMLKTAYRLSESDGSWINATSQRFKVSSIQGRRSLNKDQLRLELTAILGDSAASDLLVRCEHEGKSHDRLTIGTINN